MYKNNWQIKKVCYKINWVLDWNCFYCAWKCDKLLKTTALIAVVSLNILFCHYYLNNTVIKYVKIN